MKKSYGRIWIGLLRLIAWVSLCGSLLGGAGWLIYDFSPGGGIAAGSLSLGGFIWFCLLMFGASLAQNICQMRALLESRQTRSLLSGQPRVVEVPVTPAPVPTMSACRGGGYPAYPPAPARIGADPAFIQAQIGALDDLCSRGAISRSAWQALRQEWQRQL